VTLKTVARTADQNPTTFVERDICIAMALLLVEQLGLPVRAECAFLLCDWTPNDIALRPNTDPQPLERLGRRRAPWRTRGPAPLLRQTPEFAQAVVASEDLPDPAGTVEA
jgi:hypothetical protein